MPVKLNISENGKAWRIETEVESLLGKSIGDKFDGKEISEDLDGFELEITGGSDSAGFPLSPNIEGIALKRVLLTKGFGMRDSGNGMRRRKTQRGKVISEKTAQINIKVLTSGKKKLSEIFPDQNKVPEPEKSVESAESEKTEVTSESA